MSNIDDIIKSEINPIINKINKLDDNELILFNKFYDKSHSEFYLVKRQGKLKYDKMKCSLYNIKGLKFDVCDYDEEISMNFVDDTGIYIDTEYSVGNNLVPLKYQIGKDSIKKYLQRQRQWTEGINFKKYWKSWIITIDSYGRNKVK